MTEKIYSWADGYRPLGGRAILTAQMAAEEIERIERMTGEPVTPRLVLDVSQPEDAPLHHIFEWDDEAAAEQFRLNQAARLITAIRVVVVENAAPMPARVSIQPHGVTGNTHRNYMPVVQVQNDPDQRRQFLLRELSRIQDLLRRTEGFEEMDPIRTSCRVVRRRLEEHQHTSAAAD